MARGASQRRSAAASGACGARQEGCGKSGGDAAGTTSSRAPAMVQVSKKEVNRTRKEYECIKVCEASAMQLYETSGNLVALVHVERGNDDVSAPFTAGVIAFSERIWSTPFTQQVPLYPTSHCSRKFLAGGFLFTETTLSSLLSIAPEDHTSFSDCLAWSHAAGH